MYLDFFILKDSLLIFSHSFTLFNSVFKCCSTSLVHEFKDWIVVNRVVSSAYITYLNVLLDFGKLLMYITKRSGALSHNCSNRHSFRNAIVICNILFSIFQVAFHEQYRIFHMCVIYLIKCCGLWCQMLLIDLKIYE